MMRIQNRLERLEQIAGIGEQPPCRHVISITNEGEPIPPSVCDCDRTHINVVILESRPEGELRRFESAGWKSPYQSEAEATEQAHRFADGYNRHSCTRCGNFET